MKLGRWQKAIIEVMHTRGDVAKSRMETITTPDGQVYVPSVRTYGGRSANNFSAMWKALDGLIERGIIEKDGETFRLIEVKKKCHYRVCAYCGKREYDFTKLRPVETGIYHSESHFVHNYDCTK